MNEPPKLIVRSEQNRNSGHGRYIRTLRPRQRRIFTHPWNQPEKGIKGAFLRRYKTFFTIFALVVTIGVVSGFKMGVIYTSESKISIGARNPLPYSDNHQIAPSTDIADANVLRELAIIQSPTVTWKTFDAIGISALYPDVWSRIQNLQLPVWMDFFSTIITSLGLKDGSHYRDELTSKRKAWLIDGAYSRFLGSIKASRQSDSNILSIRLRHKDPVIAVRAVSELLRIYKEHRTEVFGHKRQLDLFRPTQERYANLLTTADSDIEEYKRAHRITSLPQQISTLEAQSRVLKKEMVNAEALLKENEAKLEDAHRELASLTQETEKPYNEPPANQSRLSEMRETLAYLEETRENLARNPVTNRQDLRNISDNIVALKKYLDKQKGPATKRDIPALNPTRQSLEKKIGRLEIDAVTLRKRLVSKKLDYEVAIDKLRSYEHQDKELNALKMKREEALKNLEEQTELMQKATLRDEQLQRSMDNVIIIQSPTIAYPATNMAIVLMLLSIPIGILLGLLTVRTLEYH